MLDKIILFNLSSVINIKFLSVKKAQVQNIRAMKINMLRWTCGHNTGEIDLKTKLYLGRGKSGIRIV